MNKIYITDKHKLAFFREKASAGFWDSHWEIHNIRKYVLNYKNDAVFIPQTMNYLPKGATVLEGGCGRGQIVHALKFNGYKPIGIDYAEKTVKAINDAVPELDIRLGDVRKLDIEDNSVDGYISAGVIEHFWDGCDDILNEMQRVIKPGGYLFVSFPSMSILRKYKAKKGLYPVANFDDLHDRKEEFYQFALNDVYVKSDLEKSGFVFVDSKKIGGLKGLKDEITFLKPLLQFIYDSRFLYPIHAFLNIILSPLTNHMTLLIMKKS